MKRHSKDEWLRDIDARQRNVVFPDTVQNEGRFWRNIYSGEQRLNAAQWVGVLLLFIFFGGSLVFYLVVLWPEGEAPWWQKVIDSYGISMLVLGACALLVILGNRRARRKRHLDGKRTDSRFSG